MKIYPLRHGVSVRPSLSFLSISVKRCEKISRGVDRGIAHSTYYVTQITVLTHDINRNAPADNTVHFITYSTANT